MSVVAVTSTDEDNAAAVFETLNDRGIGLSTPDLLRNLILRRAADETAREQVIAAWSTILSIDDEVSVDEFLRHYWVSNHGDVKARRLYREIKSNVLAEDTNSLALSRDLAESAAVYKDIVSARDDDVDLQRRLGAVKELGAKSLYPAVLSAYAAIGEEASDAKDRAAQKGQLRTFLDVLIALFVRYNVIGGRETTVMEATVYDVAAKLRHDQDFEAAIAILVLLVPDAQHFVSSFERASINRMTTVRYLLREIEHAKRATGEVAVEAPDKVHIEHIYPQTPSGQKWINHTQVINRLGNLTLLSKRFNTSVKNADFATKKAKAYEPSDIVMTKELCAYTTWDSNAVDTRQTELSAWILAIWGLPGEVQKLASDSGATLASSATGTAVSSSAAPEPDENALGADQLPEVPTG